MIEARYFDVVDLHVAVPPCVRNLEDLGGDKTEELSLEQPPVLVDSQQARWPYKKIV